ncbi:hypothetical protein CH249_01245 [Rhodococcus sp. 05-2255-3B1]|uniref:CYTH domain-containing protein n=1 Tax=unclassified Rhodococcus (in: high G+C Gram-positive bacteria) TaxID=192944 RepID=UPI000B9B44BE|nr:MULTISPECIES: hypothetical protein [unclassified Rhodococcus (in: high G+C Gram-positive bacteria)]OZE13475.1 hypothetical protein CH250_06115 [Rhodococcus sp. 05-2255-3C]OZE15909.1 hypothetical protein CH249_01245 [Rhodococcus sp. 05-2255-3B1]OZE18948.1 hypothetical protein CH255_13270 [Rhodococcus sp. 05-2255-2A2]
MTAADKPVYERERKFILADHSILKGLSWEYIIQGYIWKIDGYAIRARVIKDPARNAGEFTYEDKAGKITAKGPKYGDEREEYEIDVPVQFAQGIIDRSDLVIRKRRYHLVDADSAQIWDIDEFEDDNAGLIVAELEAMKGTEHDDTEDDDVRAAKMPRWAYREVTSDKRFNNENLASNPVSTWDDISDWKPESPWDWS